MDLGKAFRNSTLKPGHAPQAAIIYDTFHIRRHLGEAMDRVCKYEYHRLTGDDRRCIKGQKFVLLSYGDNLTNDRRNGLTELFQVNRQLCKAYLLKESFGQLWRYHRHGWARRFFHAGRDSLRWQRLPSFENRYYHGCMIHMDFKDGKIGVQHDGTDLPVVDELEKAGVPKEDIVLGFIPPDRRQYTGYAVG